MTTCLLVNLSLQGGGAWVGMGLFRRLIPDGASLVQTTNWILAFAGMTGGMGCMLESSIQIDA